MTNPAGMIAQLFGCGRCDDMRYRLMMTAARYRPGGGRVILRINARDFATLGNEYGDGLRRVDVTVGRCEIAFDGYEMPYPRSNGQGGTMWGPATRNDRLTVIGDVHLQPDEVGVDEPGPPGDVGLVRE